VSACRVRFTRLSSWNRISGYLAQHLDLAPQPPILLLGTERGVHLGDLAHDPLVAKLIEHKPSYDKM
jgi:hypothetical protein